jgi:hypothetical protein
MIINPILFSKGANGLTRKTRNPEDHRAINGHMCTVGRLRCGEGVGPCMPELSVRLFVKRMGLFSRGRILCLAPGFRGCGMHVTASVTISIRC